MYWIFSLMVKSFENVFFTTTFYLLATSKSRFFMGLLMILSRAATVEFMDNISLYKT